jgi:hypothetical protein
MAYQPAIPQETDRLKDSQGDILGNFETTGSGLGSMLNPNQGYIQFPNQGAVPTRTGTQPGFYAATSYSNISEIFVNKNITGPAQTQIPITASTLSTTAPSTGQATWFFLPSGHLVKTGIVTFTAVTNPNYLITYPVSGGVIPVFTTIISTQLTMLTVQNPTVPQTCFNIQGISVPVTGINFYMNVTPTVVFPVNVSYYTVGVGA